MRFCLSPLARGFLSGKYKRVTRAESVRYRSDGLLPERYFKSEDYDVLESAAEMAQEKGITVAQIAIAWLLHKGVTSPIIGATKIEHIEEAVAAVDLRLDCHDIERLERRYVPHTIIGHM